MWNVKDIIECPRVRQISNLGKEVSVALYLYPDRISGSEFYDQVGTEDSVAFPDINQVVKHCRGTGTKHVVLVHNHPLYKDGKSDVNPSDRDIESTMIFKNMLEQYGISLEDHIIVSPSEYYSFKANGMFETGTSYKEGVISKIKSFFFR